MNANAVLSALVAFIAMSMAQGSTPRCMSVQSGLRRVREEIEEFHVRYGKYPESLDELCRAIHPSENCALAYPLFDPWGHRFSYTGLFSVYELYSNGPDGIPNTDDDVLPDEWSPGCAASPTESAIWEEFWFCPCRTAAWILLHVNYEIRAFYHAMNRYPTELSELPEYFRGPLENLGLYSYTDPWGEPYRYGRTLSSYVLYSSGPDQLPNTDDDIYPGVWPDKCILLLTERAVVTLSLLDMGIRLFHSANKEYPRTLADLDIYFYGPWLSTVADPWGERYRYGRIPTGYVLYSSGPDREPQTDDDLFARGQASQCRPPFFENSDAILTVFDLGIALFRNTSYRWPVDLAELGIYFNRAWLETAVDQWGSPFRYSLTRSSYVLYSTGPDRLPNTDDDVFPMDTSENCGSSLGVSQKDDLPVTRKPQSGCGCSFCER